MIRFIDDHRATMGVESICRVLPIAPSTYFRLRTHAVDPTRRSARARRDDELRAAIRRVWTEHFEVYGVRKVWEQLRRERVMVARCTVRRLMRELGLCGAVRGRAGARVDHLSPLVIGPATWSSGRSRRPARISSRCRTSRTWRRGRASSTSRSSSTSFARRIVGWRVSMSLRTDFVLDALDPAIAARRGAGPAGLVHHSDQGVQHLSMRYMDRLAEAGIAPSTGSLGDAYDNALAESVIGLFKTEVIRRQGPWRHLDAVEIATLTWVDWFNTRRLLEPIGDVPPAEYEARYSEQAAVA